MRNQDSESTAGALAARPSRRDVLIAGAALVTVPLVQGQTASAGGGQTPSSPAGRTVGWASYGGDKASTKYSALAQIDRDTFSRLSVAWTWPSVEADVVRAHPGLRTWAWESTPLMVDGVVYVSTSLSQVAALDAATGKTKWVYDPETWKNGTPSNNGFVHRGVAFWADGNDRRIDLTHGLGRDVNRRHYGVSSPPIICRDVIVMGSKVHDVPVAPLPMTLSAVTDAVQRLEHRLRTEFGVAALYVFGSVARGESRPDSDIDVLVEFDGSPTFARFMDLKALLEDTLGAHVDLVTRGARRRHRAVGGSQGDAYANALPESVTGLFKTEVIRRKVPWRSLEAVEFVTRAWMEWFNARRLLAAVGRSRAEFSRHSTMPRVRWPHSTNSVATIPVRFSCACRTR